MRQRRLDGCAYFRSDQKVKSEERRTEERENKRERHVQLVEKREEGVGNLLVMRKKRVPFHPLSSLFLVPNSS